MESILQDGLCTPNVVGIYIVYFLSSPSPNLRYSPRLIPICFPIENQKLIAFCPSVIYKGLPVCIADSICWDFLNRYKDGKPIKENHTCYEPDPMKYKLGIRDVRLKHAGNYTIVLSNAKHGLYENFTLQLVVTGKHLMFLSISIALLRFFCDAALPGH